MVNTPLDPQTAWQPFEPGPSQPQPWTPSLAGHLHRRAGFSAGASEMEQTLSEGPQPAVDRLMQPAGDVAAFNAQCDGYDAAAGSSAGLSQWWLYRMLNTPHPLLEKMTLFWQGYFPANYARVNDSRLMAAHVQTLRRHALGSFRELLAAMARDPAMLVSLGADDSRKARPADGFARELLVRFTVGPEGCSEEDISETARALTGARVLRGELKHFPREHDEGEKSILGKRGTWSGDDAVRIALEHPATALTVVRKLYRWLVSETADPDDALLGPLAQSFAKDYDLAKLTETVLRSRLFFSPAAYRQRVKCPVEYALGIVRTLGAAIPTAPLAQDLATLGQSLYEPPTVAGWPGGTYWINTFTMLGRGRLARSMLSKEDRYGGKVDPAAAMAGHGVAASETAKLFVELFLQGDLDPAVKEDLLRNAPTPRDAEAVARLAHRIVTLPEFQLA